MSLNYRVSVAETKNIFFLMSFGLIEGVYYFLATSTFSFSLIKFFADFGVDFALLLFLIGA